MHCFNPTHILILYCNSNNICFVGIKRQYLILYVYLIYYIGVTKMKEKDINLNET